MPTRYRRTVDTGPLLRGARAFRPGEVGFTLVVFAGLAFGVGAGIEILRLGRELAVVAAVVILVLLVLVLLRGRPAARPASVPPRPRSPVDPIGPQRNEVRPAARTVAAVRFDARADIRAHARADAARAGAEPGALPGPLPGDPVSWAEEALLERRTLSRDRSYPPTAYFLGVAGGAALALILGGVLFLALPSDWTALGVLLVGVLAWTTVVLLSLRPPFRRSVR